MYVYKDLICLYLISKKSNELRTLRFSGPFLTSKKDSQGAISNIE